MSTEQKGDLPSHLWLRLTVTTKANCLPGEVAIGKFSAWSSLFILSWSQFPFFSSYISIIKKTHLLVTSFQQTNSKYSEI